MRYKNKVSLGDPVLEHRTRVGLREERERGARASLAIMTKLADRVAAAPGAVVPDDLWRLMRWRKLAEDTFNETAAYFLEPLHDKKPELAAHGYELLSNLMAGSFMIGATTTVSESVKQKVERDMTRFVNWGSTGGRPKTPQASAIKDLARKCHAQLSKATAAPTSTSVWNKMVRQVDYEDVSLTADERGERIFWDPGNGLPTQSISKKSFPTIFSRLKRQP